MRVATRLRIPSRYFAGTKAMTLPSLTWAGQETQPAVRQEMRQVRCREGKCPHGHVFAQLTMPPGEAKDLLRKSGHVKVA